MTSPQIVALCLAILTSVAFALLIYPGKPRHRKRGGW